MSASQQFRNAQQHHHIPPQQQHPSSGNKQHYSVQMSHSRIIEALDVARKEVEHMYKEIGPLKYQKDEAEYKLSGQYSEVAALHQTFVDLERTHNKIKHQYEEEINRLRKELESRGIPLPVSTANHGPSSAPSVVVPEGIAPPSLGQQPRQTVGSATSGAFGPLLSAAVQSDHSGVKSLPMKRPFPEDTQLASPIHRLKTPNAGTPVSAPTNYTTGTPLAYKPPEDKSNKAHHPPQSKAHHPPQSKAHYQQDLSNYSAQVLLQKSPTLKDNKVVVNATGIIEFDKWKAIPEVKTAVDDYSCYANPYLTRSLPPEIKPVVVKHIKSFKIDSVVCCVKFSTDGNLIGVGCSNQTEIYSATTLEHVMTLKEKDAKNYYIRSVVFSPDSKLVATGAEDRIVRIYDLATGDIKVRLASHSLDIYSIDWSNDGKQLASGSGDRTVKIWSAETYECVWTLSCEDTRSDDQQKDSGVTSVAIRPSDSKCVIAGSIDDTVRLWDIRTGQLLEKFVGHSSSVYAVAFSPDGESLASGSLDKTLRLWDISPETQRILQRPAPHPSNLPTGDKQPEGNNASAYPKVAVCINSKARHIFKGHKDYILSVAYPGFDSRLATTDPDGKPLPPNAIKHGVDWIVSASKDRHVTLWNAASAPAALGSTTTVKFDPYIVPVCLLSGHRNSVISVSVSPKDGLMVTGSGDMRIRLWRVARGAIKSDPTEHKSKRSLGSADDHGSRAGSALSVVPPSIKQDDDMAVDEDRPATSKA